METWKPIPSLPGYEASDLGRMRSLPRLTSRLSRSGSPSFYPVLGKVLTLHAHRQRGYVVAMRAPVCVEGKQMTVLVGRCVLEAFVGQCPPGMECCHGPGGPEDNSLGNLRWDTRSANCLDKSSWGRGHRDIRGQKSPSKPKLTFDQVNEIRRAYMAKEATARQLAARYGVTDVTVYNYTTGKFRTEA